MRVIYGSGSGRLELRWLGSGGVSSIALCGPIILDGPGLILVMVAVALGVAAMMSITLCATIKIDAKNRLTIRYLIYSFSDQLENIRPVNNSKIAFRRDDRFGFKKLYMGTRLPCFHVGWFRLRNGAVGFLCLSRKRKARAFITNDGCYILLDPRVARQIQIWVTENALQIHSKSLVSQEIVK